MRKLAVVQMARIKKCIKRKRNVAFSCLYLLTFFFVNCGWAQPLRLPCGGTTCTTYKVDLSTQEIVLRYRDLDGSRFGSIASLEKWEKSQGKRLKFATNAGIFSTRFVPLGLTIIEGREVVGLDREEGSGNFYLKPNGIFSVTENQARIIETSKYVPIESSCATQSGPLLLNQGTIHPKFQPGSTNVKIRNAVGVISDSQVIFAISDGPINFYDLATFFRDTLSCRNALYLDGVISKMYIPEISNAGNGGDFASIFAVHEK